MKDFATLHNIHVPDVYIGKKGDIPSYTMYMNVPRSCVQWHIQEGGPLGQGYLEKVFRHLEKIDLAHLMVHVYIYISSLPQTLFRHQLLGLGDLPAPPEP